MEIYYINMSARADRRAFMEAQFARLGLHASRIDGLTPGQLSSADLNRYCSPGDWRSLPPSALCCRLSHLAAARALLGSGAQYAMILEDDAVLSARLPAFLKAFESASLQIDLLRLETYFEGIRHADPESTLDGISIIRPFSWEPGAAGYILSRHGAETLLQHPTLRARNDHTLFNPFGWLARRIVLRQATPALCVQSHHPAAGVPNFGSDNNAAANGPHIETPAWQSAARQATLFVKREFIFGPQKLAHQLMGAAKHDVPFQPH